MPKKTKKKPLGEQIGLPPESVILRRDGLEVRTPACPEPCDYVRVVQVKADGTEREMVYWDRAEWQEDAEDGVTGAMGALMGAIKSVADGTFTPV